MYYVHKEPRRTATQARALLHGTQIQGYTLEKAVRSLVYSCTTINNKERSFFFNNPRVRGRQLGRVRTRESKNKSAPTTLAQQQ